MSNKLKIFVMFIGCVGLVDTSFGQTVLKHTNRASSQDLCLQVSPSGTAADGLCINGTTKTVNLPVGFAINGGTTMGSFVEGTFTPTFSNFVNVASVGSISFTYQRIGTQVHVWGSADMTYTTANTFTTFTMTVPITAVTSLGDTRASGTGAEGDSGTTGVVHAIRGGSNTTTVAVQAFIRTTGIKSTRFHYTYRVD